MQTQSLITFIAIFFLGITGCDSDRQKEVEPSKGEQLVKDLNQAYSDNEAVSAISELNERELKLALQASKNKGFTSPDRLKPELMLTLWNKHKSTIKNWPDSRNQLKRYFMLHFPSLRHDMDIVPPHNTAEQVARFSKDSVSLSEAYFKEEALSYSEVLIICKEESGIREFEYHLDFLNEYFPGWQLKEFGYEYTFHDKGVVRVTTLGDLDKVPRVRHKHGIKGYGALYIRGDIHNLDSVFTTIVDDRVLEKGAVVVGSPHSWVCTGMLLQHLYYPYTMKGVYNTLDTDLFVARFSKNLVKGGMSLKEANSVVMKEVPNYNNFVYTPYGNFTNTVYEQMQ